MGRTARRVVIVAVVVVMAVLLFDCEAIYCLCLLDGFTLLFSCQISTGSSVCVVVFFLLKSLICCCVALFV